MWGIRPELSTASTILVNLRVGRAEVAGRLGQPGEHDVRLPAARERGDVEARHARGVLASPPLGDRLDVGRDLRAPAATLWSLPSDAIA